MIEIREERLRELLMHREKFIGTPEIPWDGIFADVAFLMSILLSDYKPVLGIPKHIVQIIFLILFFVYSFILLVKTYRSLKNSYTTKDLYEDIYNSADRAHAFNLIVIRNTFDTPSNKFLLLYDRRWKCSLLPYCKSGKNDNEDLQMIIEFIYNRLGVNVCKDNIEKKMEREHDKYSVSDKVYKKYIHSFYEVDISPYIQSPHNSRLTRKRFEIDGYIFGWYTTAEMMNNRSIREKNKETVEDLMGLYG